MAPGRVLAFESAHKARDSTLGYSVPESTIVSGPGSPGNEAPPLGKAEAGVRRSVLHPAVRFIIVLIAFAGVVAAISSPPPSLELRVHWSPRLGSLWAFGLPLFTWLAGGFWVVLGTASWRHPHRRGLHYAVIAGIMILLGLCILAGTMLWFLSMAMGPVR